MSMFHPLASRRRGLRAACTVFALVACLCGAGSVAAQPPAQNGRGLIEPVPIRTQAYGYDDGHVILNVEPGLQTSALQYLRFTSDRVARLVTVIGAETEVAGRPLYSALRGFRALQGGAPPVLAGENTLQIAGQVYRPTRKGMMSRSEIARNWPTFNLSALVPVTEADVYAVIEWDGVVIGNGKPVHSGRGIGGLNGIIDMFTAPIRLVGIYHTLSVDCGCPADRHRLLITPGVEVVATNHFRPVGTGLHAEVLTVLGRAGQERPWSGVRGLTENEVRIQGPSSFLDAAGREHLSTPRWMTKEQIVNTWPQMDVSHLTGEGLYLADYWPSVQLLSNMRGNSVSRIRGQLVVNGRLLRIDGLTVESGENALGNLDLSGLLEAREQGQVALLRPEPWWPIVVHPTGWIIDANVGILSRVGDRVQGVIDIGGPSTPVRGVLVEQVELVNLEPWTTEVELLGVVRMESLGEVRLPLAKEEMDFVVRARRTVDGRLDLVFSTERGNAIETFLVPVALRGVERGTSIQALPARFLGSAILSGFDAATGTFTGKVVRTQVPVGN